MENIYIYQQNHQVKYIIPKNSTAVGDYVMKRSISLSANKKVNGN